ncbi:type IV toxin-antitoxin system AbiEi family antitoxin domain-containing protein [Gracilibacillus sp. YIM 98692]|uniref:type IV toxin-antitoxin system AbiEi family antitoxin domain-containing protein n=1 Tax=Gracilibacillus sp. YIM 98692 TaxID=2663532 RepID=UPI001969EC97|nr:type IV toxin-antitoxin system AbiEi family antitoxin domain-containing protein [Gracilibacillus sp. YIM 98692]
MSSKESSKNIKIVTTKEISEILNLGDRRIRQLANENALVRIGHGKYDLPASINSYIEYVVDREKPEGDLDKTEEEALWTRARRKKTELELQIMRGELHRSEDVKLVMNDMLGAFRARLLGLPSKTAPQILGKSEIPAIKNVLKDAVFEALEELSDYDPHVFYEKSKDKMYLDEGEEELLEMEKIKEEEINNNGSKKKK